MWLVGSQFPNQGLNAGHCSKALNPSHQPTRNQRLGTSFWPVSCAEMNFHIEQKVVKQVKCLLGGERVHVHRYTGGLRERVKPSWQFKSLLWNISSGFPWAIFFVAFFLSPLLGLWYLSCLTRDRTWAHSSENSCLNHWTAREILGQSSCFAWFWACVGCISGSSHGHMCLLAKMDSSKEAYGKVDITYSEVTPTLFWPPRSLSAHV